MKKQIGSALALYPPGGVAPWWTASPMVYGPAIAAIRPKHLQRHKPRRGFCLGLCLCNICQIKKQPY